MNDLSRPATSGAVTPEPMDAGSPPNAGELPELSVVIPCLNEEDNLQRIYRRVGAQLSGFEILFIDDGSTDRTLPILKSLAEKDPRVKYLSFTRNFGLDAAFQAGFKYAGKPWIVQLDADLQSPPEEIPRLVQRAQSGFDVVFARRFDRQDSFFKTFASRLQHFVAVHLFRIEFPVGASTFRVIKTEVAQKVASNRTAYPYFLADCLRLGTRFDFVDVAHRAREAGTSKFTLGVSLGATFRLLLGQSLAPLYGACLGALCALPALLFLPTAWSLPLGLAIVAICLAVQGLYLARLVRESSFRQLYLIREANIPVDPADCLFGTASAPKSEGKALS